MVLLPLPWRHVISSISTRRYLIRPQQPSVEPKEKNVDATTFSVSKRSPFSADVHATDTNVYIACTRDYRPNKRDYRPNKRNSVAYTLNQIRVAINGEGPLLPPCH